MRPPHLSSGREEVLRCLSPAPDTLAFAGSLTFTTAAQALREGSQALARRSRLDLSGVEHTDSAGLAVVLALLAQASRGGQPLALLHAPEGMLALAEVCDARGLLERGATPRAPDPAQ